MSTGDLRHFDMTVHCAAHFAGAILTQNFCSECWQELIKVKRSELDHTIIDELAIIVDLLDVAFLRRPDNKDTMLCSTNMHLELYLVKI